jgi:tryptophan synthase beta chain
MNVPESWYNILADLDFTLPPDLPPETPPSAGINPQVPLSLARQEMSRQPSIAIPDTVRELYGQWRPTPLRRARSFEKALGTRARIYWKYEGGNLTGSHKLNTAIAQAYYYKKAGAKRLAVATGAGQWGTAVAAACRMFGLECRVYMVRASLESKPQRRTMMELLSASVAASPSQDTETGRRFLAEGQESGTLAIALAEAVEETRDPGTRFCAGSAETYSLLHNTVIGLEAREQMRDLGEQPDIVVASLGAGSNFGGIVFPFLRERLTGGRRVRCIAVEPAACPKLTRGRYAYDYTDSSRQTPMQKVYTLGHRFVPPAMHAGGLRYHATAKLVSALYHHDMIEAAAYQQREVFRSAALFAEREGVLPAPESAHAVHDAVVRAAQADERGESPAILLALSGHGTFDLAAYQSYLDGQMADDVLPDEAIERSLAQLPPQPASDFADAPQLAVSTALRGRS